MTADELYMTLVKQAGFAGSLGHSRATQLLLVSLTAKSRLLGNAAVQRTRRNQLTANLSAEIAE